MVTNATRQCQFAEEGFAAAYALAALDGDERRAFEEHLAGCAVCAAEADALRATVAQLPLAVGDDDSTPSAGLRARILDAVAAENAAGGADPRPAARRGSAAPTPLFGRWRLPQAYAAAAVLLLALGLGLLGWNFNLQREIRQARAERDAALAEGNAARAALEVWTLGATGGQPASGQVLYLPDYQQAILTVSGLPPLQPGQVYQVWLIPEGQAPQGAGILVAPSGEGETAMRRDMTQYRQLAITIEPGPGGSTTPTSAPILAGTLD